MKLLFSLFAASLLSLSPVFGDLHISTQLPKNAGTAALHLDGGEDPRSSIRIFYSGDNEPSLRREAGQLFVAPSDVEGKPVRALRLKISDAEVGKNARGAEVELAFYHLPGGDVGSRTLLSSQSGKLPSELAPKDSLYFDFDPVPLKSGETYLFMLHWKKPALRQLFNLQTSGQSLPTNGNLVIYGLEKGGGDSVDFRNGKGNFVFTLYTED